MTIRNPAFCLALYLTGVHFRGELQHVGLVGEQKIKCRPIRTREIAGVRLQDKLYECYRKLLQSVTGVFQSVRGITKCDKKLSKSVTGIRNPVNIYLFQVSQRSTRKRCEICSKLTIKKPERLH